MNKTVGTAIVAAVLAAAVFGGGGFAGGLFLGKAQAAKGLAAGLQGGPDGAVFRGQGLPGGAQGRMMLRGGPGGPNGARGGFVAGKVTEKGDGDFTVEAPDGSSKTVYYSDSTEFQKFADSSAADVSVGSTVSVAGESSDGGVTAKQVTVMPKE